MADKRKGKQRKLDEEEKPTKEEYAVAKYLRFGLPVREGKLHGMEVQCFFGNAAVDKLLESKWSSSKNQKDPLFTNRLTCVTYLVRLLEKGLFHRAEREKRKKDKEKEKDKGSKKKKKDGEKEEVAAIEDSSPRARKTKKEKKGKKEKEGEGAVEEEAAKSGEKEEEKDKKDDKKKKEKRLKLVMPEQQYFEDSDEVYVWIYDPVNAKTFFIGLLMVLGAIGLCMFPLWPANIRIGVYYLSLAAAGFVGFILFLVVVRLILFCLVWGLTFGRHHFWFLPNLTEDVGFFDSFRPLYKHDILASLEEAEAKAKEGKKKKGKEKGKEPSSGDGLKSEDTGGDKEKSSDKDDSDEFEVIKKEDLDENVEEDAGDDEENEGNAEEGDEDANDNEDDDANGDEEGGDYEEEDEEEEEEENRDSEENEDNSESTEPKKTK